MNINLESDRKISEQELATFMAMTIEQMHSENQRNIEEARVFRAEQAKLALEAKQIEAQTKKTMRDHDATWWQIAGTLMLGIAAVAGAIVGVGKLVFGQ